MKTRPASTFIAVLLLAKPAFAQSSLPSNNPLGDALDTWGRKLHLEKPLSCKPSESGGAIPYQCTPKSKAEQREALGRFMEFNQLFGPSFSRLGCGSYPTRTILGRTIWRQRGCGAGGAPFE
jgi:hypothetical protein